MMNRNAWGLLVIVLLVGVALYIGEQPGQLLLPKPKSQVTSAASYALLANSHSTQFNEAGQPSYSYKADTMEYFRVDLSRVSADDYSLISHPQLVFYGEGLPWRIEAKSGKVTDQGDTLDLWDAVRIWQERVDGKSTLLTTDSLTIKPKTHLIDTDAPVTIVGPTGTLTATGLSVNLHTQRLKLHSKVKGQHDPLY